MKRIIYIFITVLLLGSCINDLDMKPIDPDSSDVNVIFSTEEGTKGALAKLYASFAYNGQGDGVEEIQGIREDFSNFLRQYFTLQEASTEEAIVAWNDQTIKNFHWHTWAANDAFIEAVYSRIYFSIALANDFIRNIDISVVSDDDKATYTAEARFLRAFAYWVGVDMFGNIPIIDENFSGSTPEQNTREEVFNYVESELLELENLLAPDGSNEYGRVDQVAAWMLLAKLYLNAEVYTGTARYTDAMTYINKVIGSSYSIDPNYRRIFSSDNDLSPEIIFPLCYDGIYSQSHGTTFIIHASSGGYLPVGAVRGVGGTGWGGYRAVTQLPEKFGLSESDFPLGGALSNIPDSRAMFYFNYTNPEKPATAVWQWSVDNAGEFTEGIGVYKYTNLKSTGEQADNYNADFVSTDYPMFRLADAYLMYAEAYLRGGGGVLSTAVGYINELRERAYGNTSGNISESDLDLDFMLEERAREMYWECQRRTDLIRFGKFSSNDYVWEWKGNVKEGTGFSSHRNLYPIPAAQLTANPNLKQNTGY